MINSVDEGEQQASVPHDPPGNRAGLHLSVDGSAGLLNCTDDVPVPDGTGDVPVPALRVLLGVGKQEHENQSRYDTSGYDVLRHGRRSVVVDGDDQGLEVQDY
jgi:hypothetical protein